MRSEEKIPCPSCQTLTDRGILKEAHHYVFWKQNDGACPACVQQHLLETLLDDGHAAFHERIQTVWPLNAEAAFGALPTPLRLHADPRFTGHGQTIALIDAGFYPHPDLTQPANRIKAWVDASGESVHALAFSAGSHPSWPGWQEARAGQWHGLMTSVASAGNGFLSHGLYRGMAPEAHVVLIRVQNSQGQITDASILRALQWVLSEGGRYGIGVVSLSVGGDTLAPYAGHPIDESIGALVEAGVVVVAAAGNDGVRQLIPPATAPAALTIGGIDDKNSFDHRAVTLWHSNYGEASNGASKPELVAPSIWVAAPLLPDTPTASEACHLFENRSPHVEGRIAELKLITPHYQHVDGTSFAAPVVAGTVACILEANGGMTPRLVRDVLCSTAQPVPGVSVERQGAGALDAGRAVARALMEHHELSIASPEVTADGVSFALHDHQASQVVVYGSWNDWSSSPFVASLAEPGLWKTPYIDIPPGRHMYKFLIDGDRWLDDPANPNKFPDRFGGLNSVFSC